MIVSSHNEWDQLEEVIVGDGFPEELPLLDYSFKLFFHCNLWNGRKYQVGDQFVSKRHVIEHNEDIEQFVDLLKSLNIIVRRPKVPKKARHIRTMAWESISHPALNVRDMAMIVGESIIETPPTIRYRYFENDLLHHIFLDYFKSGASWIQAPKPIMTDRSFDLGHVEEETGRKLYSSVVSPPSYLDCGHEIMFDAANCVRMGEHILMNVSNKNQELGAEWLRRVLGDKYKILQCSVTDSHIDSSFLPIRPGVAIITQLSIKDLLPPQFNNWDLIYIPTLTRNTKSRESQGLLLASDRIGLNVLSVSPELIICHPQYVDVLASKVKKYKIDVIGSPFRHCQIFSGAHHCTTLDIRRKGNLENYF